AGLELEIVLQARRDARVREALAEVAEREDVGDRGLGREREEPRAPRRPFLDDRREPLPFPRLQRRDLRVGPPDEPLDRAPERRSHLAAALRLAGRRLAEPRAVVSAARERAEEADDEPRGPAVAPAAESLAEEERARRGVARSEPGQKLAFDGRLEEPAALVLVEHDGARGGPPCD